MDQAVKSAMEADIVHLALAAVGVLAVALALLVYFGSRAINGILTAFSKAIAAYTTLTEAVAQQGNQLASMVRTLEKGQDVQRDMVLATNSVRDALIRHEEKSAVYVQQIQEKADENHKSLLEQIDEKSRAAITDIIGETRRVVDASTERLINLFQPALEPLGEMRIELKKMREDEERRITAEEQRAAAEEQRATARQAQLDGIEAKIATTEHKVITAMTELMAQMKGDEDGEQIADDLGGVSPAGGGVSAGGTSGSTGDNRAGINGDTTDGSNVSRDR